MPGFPGLPAQTLVPVYTEFLKLVGLPRAPINDELVAAEKFMALETLTLGDVVTLARAFSTGDVVGIRSALKQDIYDGDYDAPLGGQGILREADKLVRLAARPNERLTPWLAHLRWMRLMPLTSCNLIAGLSIWCWMRKKIDGKVPAEFVRSWYHETLDANRGE